MIEEAFNGIRSVKKSQKVRVYGLDSTREVRHRLIEILYDRVALHKDKFVAPILHHEMQSMTVKKNGKVEHSDNSHDDQVFSYLMALYVWYDGKNLAENFHIIKNVLKTDQDEDIEELAIEDQLEAVEKVDIDNSVFEEDSEVSYQLKYLESIGPFVTSRDLKESTYLKESELRDRVLSSNKEARESYAKEHGTDPSMYNLQYGGTNYSVLPNSLFDPDSNDFYFDDEDGPPRQRTTVVGNLADLWDKI